MLLASDCSYLCFYVIVIASSILKKFVRKYYEQLYAKKLYNLEEIVKLLEIYNLPWLNQKETENLNRLNSTNETEAVIRKNKQKNCPTYKSSVLEGFTSEFAKIFKEE